MTTTIRRSLGSVFLLWSLLLNLVSTLAAQSAGVADPLQSFVDGFNPTDEDFFARSPQETLLLRMRFDLDGDGRTDLALSESSVFGNGGGPWLVFRRSSTSGCRYVGRIFAAPGDLRIERGNHGALLLAGSALSADVTHLLRYRVNADTLVQLREQDTVDVTDAAGQAILQSCRLLDYKRDALHCWHSDWPSK